MVLSVMIITCPSCATRYSLDDSKMPDDGRQVRCVQCSHVWHQERSEPDDLLSLDETETGSSASEVPQLEEVPEAETPVEAAPDVELTEDPTDEPTAESDEGEEAPEANAQETEEAEIVDGPVESDEPIENEDGESVQDSDGPSDTDAPLAGAGSSAWRSVRERTVVEEEPPKRTDAVGWAILGVIVLSILAAIVFFRPELEEAWPPSQRFYATIDGWMGEESHEEEAATEKATAPASAYVNVSINIKSSRIAVVNGERVLLIEGVISNSGDAVATIPNLRGSLRGEKGETLYTWDFSVPFMTIEAGAQQDFETRVVDPPSGAKSMNLDPVIEN